jgi:hypothetical protein
LPIAPRQFPIMALEAGLISRVCKIEIQPFVSSRMGKPDRSAISVAAVLANQLPRSVSRAVA